MAGSHTALQSLAAPGPDAASALQLHLHWGAALLTAPAAQTLHTAGSGHEVQACKRVLERSSKQVQGSRGTRVHSGRQRRRRRRQQASDGQWTAAQHCLSLNVPARTCVERSCAPSSAHGARRTAVRSLQQLRAFRELRSPHKKKSSC